MRKAMLGVVAVILGLGAVPGVAAAASGCEVAILDTAMYEGSLGGAKMGFGVTATEGCAGTVKYRTVVTPAGEGVANTPEDYTAVSGVLAVSGGAPMSVQVPVVPDQKVEPDEVVRVELYEASGVAITRAVAVGKILNDEGVVLGVDAGKIYWGPEHVDIPVDISAAPEAPVTVHFRTRNGTAVDGVHYSSVRGVLTLEPGSTSAVVSVPLLAGADLEPGAYFYFELFDPSAGVVGTARVSVTVRP
ncbi:hypothetical protein L6E12_02120 [Actinokineospora sp. PR83]|uniref:Calx-beta domain-containing protein n=1 Tax=Actinokineospora sp. PR83 TaxID=2884908 RepID=UPI001F2C3217|nr:Calx-beta domain-containing protein [Actinokineospora sp. PR83]MCG8914590.1 hypothetical protein [Actinokineospora sp. PR83]